jgi:NADPH2:quinone reductase
MHAIRAPRAGGPEILEYVELPEPAPGPGEVLVELAAAGVNFIDTYRRSGVYPVSYPHVLGSEGSGRVIALGDGVTRLAEGDRVAWNDGPGSYAERVVVRADRALAVPAAVADDVAAAIPLQGLTAHYLVTASHPVKPGEVVLVHAAAGGVGLLLTQLAVARGARVIGTVSTAAKETLAREAGASDVVRYTELADLATDLPARVRELTGGVGVDAVYDGVGKDTFDGSLSSLRVRGTMVLFGGASGQVPLFDLQRLNALGSLTITRPSIGAFVADPAELAWRAGEIFAAVVAGTLRVHIGATFALHDAAKAHRALESRATTGKVVLIP